MNDAELFLSCFKGNQTFQTFDDKGKDKSLSHVFHEYDHEKLKALNDKGAGIFFMVNEGDGGGRKNKNVVRVRAFFADFDGIPLPKEWPVKPDIFVRTSAGHFHAYWLVEDDCPLEHFKSIQQAIAKYYGSDASVNDLARVMRVPGFDHMKGEKPWMVQVVS